MDYAAFAENHRFQIPPGAHWNDVRQQASEVGKAIQHLRKDRKKTAGEVGNILGYTERYIKQLSSIARLDQKSITGLIKSGVEPTVKNLETLLRKKEGRGETISPPKNNKISVNITSLSERQKDSFIKEFNSLLKKYKLHICLLELHLFHIC